MVVARLDGCRFAAVCGWVLGVSHEKPSPRHVARMASATPALPGSSPRITVGLAVVGAVNEPTGWGGPRLSPAHFKVRPATSTLHHHPRGPARPKLHPKPLRPPAALGILGVVTDLVAQQSRRAASLSPWWSCQIASTARDARHSGLQSADPSGVAAPSDGSLVDVIKCRRRHHGTLVRRIRDWGTRRMHQLPLSRPLKPRR